jgi:hypothetical protein
MRCPAPLTDMKCIFTDPLELAKWFELIQPMQFGAVCFAAIIDGWYVLAEWDGNPERPPRTIARHARGFWEFDSDYIFGVGNKPLQEH